MKLTIRSRILSSRSLLLGGASAAYPAISISNISCSNRISSGHDVVIGDTAVLLRVNVVIAGNVMLLVLKRDR